MPQGVFTLSPFRLSMFYQCPRRYKYHYLDRLYEQYRKFWPHLTMGDNVHRALKRFLSPANRNRTAPALEALLREVWNRRGFRSAEEEADYFGRAVGHLRWFCATQDTAAQPFRSEALYRVYLAPDLLVLAKVDRVDQGADGALHVVDYKTGKTPRQIDYLQVLIYALILDRLAPKWNLPAGVSGASYLYLNGDGWRGVAPTVERLQQTETELLRARDEIRAEQDFPPYPSRLCAYCDFGDLCDHGREWRAGSDDEPTFPDDEL